MIESEDEDEDDDDDEITSSDSEKANILTSFPETKPFANEVEASSSLRGYTKRTKVTVDQDFVLTSSGLNIIKSILPRTLQLMTLSRGVHAFDLFLQLTRVCQVYLYSVLCMFSTCHPCNYDREGVEY